MSEGGFARGPSHSGTASCVSAPAQRERSPQEQAIAAHGIATNIVGHEAQVTTSIATMTAAAAGGDGAAYAAAMKAAEAAIQWLESASPEVAGVVAAAAPAAAATLHGLAKTIAAAKESIASAPPAPVDAGPALSCDAALRAALPSIDSPPGVSDPAIIDAITRVIRFQSAPGDLGPMKALFTDAATRQPGTELARRIARLELATLTQFRSMLGTDTLRREVIVSHRERVAARKAGPRTGPDAAEAKVAATPVGAVDGTSTEVDDSEVDDSEIDPVVDALAHEAGVPLPDVASYAPSVGADVSSARVVTGARAELAADAVDARGFTVGDRVFLGAGERPDDRGLMEHELRHVAQQQDAAQQPDATAIDAGALPVTTSSDASEREAAMPAEAGLDGASATEPTAGELQIARAPRGATTRATRDIDAVVRSLAGRSDEALRARKAKLTVELAADLSPKDRTERSRERDAIGWLEYLRRLERGEDGRARDDAQDRDAAQGAAATAGVDPTQTAARSHVESSYRAGGTWAALTTSPPAGDAGATRRQRADVTAEASEFADDFRAQARHTALGMLDASSSEIDAALKQYGFVGGSHRLKFAAQDYNRDPGRLAELVEDWRTLSHADERKAESRQGGGQQVALAKVVGELRTLSAEANRLRVEERSLSDSDWAARDALGVPTSHGVNARLAEAWLEAEATHPILLAFRHHKYGAVTDALGGMTAEGAGMEQSILRQAIPKLGNVLRVKTAVTRGQLDPLRLGPVVEVTKQQMRVPPGSVRDAVTRDLHAVASTESVTDEILSALSIALALVSFVPGVGAPAKVLAEATSLAIELRAQVNEYKEWKVAGGMNNTALDVARSVSTRAPGLRPLLLRLAVVGASAASLVQLSRLAIKLERVQDAGGVADDVLREIDDLGAQVGAKNLSDEVAGAVRGAGTYPARAFDKADGTTALSKINAEKVKAGLEKAGRRGYVGGARLESQLAKATAEGATGTLHVPGGASGTVEVRLEIRFQADLSAATHGADAGPARLTLDHADGAWVARVQIDHHIDPRNVEFVVGHEVDEIAELVRRYPDGKPAGGFEAEMSAGVMRDGARTNQSTAHDVATAREIVALHRDHAKLLTTGSDYAKEREKTLGAALKAAGLDEVAEIDAKLRLLKQSGAPDELLDEVRMVASRKLAAEHAGARGAKGSRFTDEMVDHTMWARGQGTSDFVATGVSGGHDTTRLLEMGFPNSEYVFVQVADKAVGDTTARRFAQFKWRGQGPVPPPGGGRFPTDTPFDDIGWATTDMPKTTFDDPEAFLREAEDAFDKWIDAGAIGTGNDSRAWSAVSSKGIPISGFFEATATGPMPRTAFVEAKWF